MTDTTIELTQCKKKLPGLVTGALDKIYSPAAVSFAQTLFLTALSYTPSSREQAFLDRGTKLRLHTERHTLHGWRWGTGPAILVCHGWSGHVAQFTQIAEALVDAGYSVIGFNFPGHGNSKGKRPTLFDFVRSIEVIRDTYGPFRAVVAHSLGALAASVVAAQSDFANRLVLIGSLPSASEAVSAFSKLSGISGDVLARMRRKIERRYNKDFDQYDFEAIAGEISCPALVVHDQNDKWTSWESTARWVEKTRTATLHTTSGLGHSRILKDEAVISSLMSFLGKPRGNVRDLFLSEFAL